MESAAAQKLERQLAKVEKKRRVLQALSTLQFAAGPPVAVWVLYLSPAEATALIERSTIAICLAVVGSLWSMVGMLGFYAVTRKRLQSLDVFTSLEVFAALITACSGAVLLLLHHEHCWEPSQSPSAQLASAQALSAQQEAHRQHWLRCPNVVYLLGVTALMVVYLSGTASEALSLRLRIQKTGKRNLNWNHKPQRWKERNLRRGASAALRALSSKDDRAEDDNRIKCAAPHVGLWRQRFLTAG